VKALVLAAVLLALPGGRATPPDELLLKDYQPHSIYNIPQTRVERARYPVIDVHTHVYATNDAQVERWVKTMDDVNLQKSIILSGNVGPRFDQVLARFG